MWKVVSKLGMNVDQTAEKRRRDKDLVGGWRAEKF